MKFAAIDIGTNAVRLLLARVIEDGDGPYLKKETLVRMPLRLGGDVFGEGRISVVKAQQLVETMQGFRHLITAYPAVDYLAVATSAMREADNGKLVVEQVRDAAGIDIEIISGRREAEVIIANHIERRLNPSRNYLYVDVGGGSTEVTLIHKRKVVATRSFRLGTVRILKNKVRKKTWSEMKDWTRHNREKYRTLQGIGSGGNINKIFKLARGKEGRPVTYKVMREMADYLKSYSLEERIVTLGLRPDRADVIVPACDIYLSIMKWARIKQMHVPQFGLSDGIVHILYDRYRHS